MNNNVIKNSVYNLTSRYSIKQTQFIKKICELIDSCRIIEATDK